MDDIDKLLAGIDNKPPAKPLPSQIEPPQAAVSLSIDDLLGGLDESVKRNVRQQLSLHPHHLVIAQDEKARVELVRQQEIEVEQQRQERLKQQRLEQLNIQRREELRHQAQKWLNKLQAKSEEGRWFEEFACNYESRLEAAIDYLEALQEVNDMLPKR